MVNGTNLVWNYLDKSSDIRRDLSRGIINVRSLAKHILKENPGLGMKSTGVISAVKRYISEQDFNISESELQKIFANTKLEMAFGNVILHINKTESSVSALSELFKKLNLIGDDNVNFVMDKASFAIIFDDMHQSLIRSQFTNEKIINELDNIGQITLRFDPAVMQTPNVFATVLNEIGINRINVIDSITKRERFMIFVQEKDLMNTCNILYKFTKEGNIAKC